MDQLLSNPAGRLWLFMQATWGAGDNSPIRAAWEPYFGASDDDPTPLLRGLAEMMVTPHEIEIAALQINHSPAIRAKMLRPLPKARQVLSFARYLDTPGTTVKSGFDLSDIADLELCAITLDEALNWAKPDDELLQQLKAKAREMESDLSSADGMDSEFVTYLFGMLRRIINAVDLYQAGGAEPLRAEFDRFFGRIRLDKQGVENVASNPQLSARLTSILIILGMVVTPIAHDTASIAASTAKIAVSVEQMVKTELDTVGLFQRAIEGPKKAKA